jgi:hypothetical protein
MPLAALFPRKQPQYRLDRRLDESQNWFGQGVEEKILALTGT